MSRKAFTLIEILVVIAILIVLASFLLGAASYIYDEAARRQTQATQRVVASIIDAFHETFDKYPPDTNPLSSSYKPDTSVEALLVYITGNLKDDDYKYIMGRAPIKNKYVNELDILNERIRNMTLGKLLTLSQDTYSPSSAGGGVIRDAYENAMRYEVAGGLGGRPVLISAGEDGNFTTTDDIRSDEH